MTAEQTKTNIIESLSIFGKGNLTETSLKFFENLGYTSDKQAPLYSPTFKEFQDNYIVDKNFDEVKAKVNEWKYIDLLFQLTKEEVSKQSTLFDTKKVDRTIIETYLFFVIELIKNEYTRTELSNITREINRLFPMPAMILFKHGNTLTLSVINRRLNKRDSIKDVLEKVTLIKDINIENPHRAHIEILYDLTFDELKSKHQFTNFVELHNAWQKTLDTKELNKRFYSELFNWYLWAVRSVNFPNDVNDDKDDMVYNSESVIRLLTRLIFVWFIKEKNLVPNSLFEQKKLKDILKGFQPHSMESSVYYRAILQNLFFATLNTPMDKDITEENKDEKRRFINTLPKTGNDQYLDQTKYRYQNHFTKPEKALELFSTIPFLNGGLFECLDFIEINKETGRPKEMRFDGFSSTEKRQAFVPDKLFFADEFMLDLNAEYGTKGKKYKVEGLINILDSYKFTITENTPLEEEIALDPELLGKVFENLLASYNPETQTTARKQTGSFYTPREIVNYMVDESLIAYFKQKLGSSDEIESKLRDLFSHAIDLPEFTEKETEHFIKAISEAKILDPACGSGAFPMGVLHRMVDLLNKLDPENKRWNELQIQRAIDETAGVYREGNNSEERKLRLDEIEKAFDLSMNFPDYARKLFLIENCIYGVDIQQIAIQISKLRFFIALIVDQKVNDTKSNRNILSMPNLETKFVAANTLIGLDKPQQMTLMAGDVVRLEKELASIRHKIFFIRKYSAKKALKKREKEKREELKKALENSGYTKNVAGQMAGWNPFDPINSATFFDAKTMFGFDSGFNIIIGNPPYISYYSGQAAKISPSEYKVYIEHYDFIENKKARNRLGTVMMFLEKTYKTLKNNSNATFIIDINIFSDAYIPIRKYLHNKISINFMVTNLSEFENVGSGQIIFSFNKDYKRSNRFKVYSEFLDEKPILIEQSKVNEKNYYSLKFSSTESLVEKINEDNVPIVQVANIISGMNIGGVKDYFLSETIKDKTYHKAILSGNIFRYEIKYPNEVQERNPRNKYIRFDKNIEKMIWDNKLGTPSIGENDSKFKQNKILLRRPLTGDGKLAAAYSEDFDHYSDVTVYIINEKEISLKYLLGIINSKLASYYCKETGIIRAEKGQQPQITINRFKEFPIKYSTNTNAIVNIVEYILCFKDNFGDTSFFERLIDAIVYELYLPEEIKAGGADVLKYLNDLPELSKDDEAKNLKTIERVYKELSDPKHPISAALLKLLTIEAVNIIEGRK